MKIFHNLSCDLYKITVIYFEKIYSLTAPFYDTCKNKINSQSILKLFFIALKTILNSKSLQNIIIKSQMQYQKFLYLFVFFH